MVEPDNQDLSIRRQCDLLELSRSSYYRPPVFETEENLKLMRMIDEEYTRHPFFGSLLSDNYTSLVTTITLPY